jgi:predicted DCC family thiol-disulfide oxidoreductase YuxK
MRLVPMRHCERCHHVRFVWTMVFVRRPLGGRAYWICRNCRHKWHGRLGGRFSRRASDRSSTNKSVVVLGSNDADGTSALG